jgi:hypothetical protein
MVILNFLKILGDIYKSRTQGEPPVSMTSVANVPTVSMTVQANLPPMSTTPLANLPLVSTTPAANLAPGTAGVVDTGGK